MGQSNSRNRSDTTPSPRAPTSSNAQREASSSSSNSTPASPTPSVPKPSPSRRRSTVRQNLSKLVHPRSTEPTSDRDDASPRRSWRNSRRWSKTTAEIVRPAQTQDVNQLDISPTLTTLQENEKGQEKDLEYEIEPGPSVVPIEQTQPSSSESVPPHPDGADEGASDGIIQSTIEQLGTDQPLPAQNLGVSRPSSQEHDDPGDEIIIGPQMFENNRDAHDETTPSDPATIPATTTDTPEMPEGTTTASPQQQQALQRQFPPPGTLVVVQGVVHTTDLPRPQPSDAPASTSHSLLSVSGTEHRRSASTPRPSRPSTAGSERSSARHRLSALIRPRPASMLVSTPDSSPLSESTELQSSSASHETPSTSPETSSDGGNDSTPQTVDSESQSSAVPAPVDVPRSSGTISPSSIEVLGTLLSVAAAATAASLLTGSSEPILAPPGGGIISSSPGTGNPTMSRPTSPTPTASLGGEQGRGERMRQAWGSIRERLGLRTPNNTSLTGGGTEPITGRRPDGTQMDAREIMLAEMARAFNLGLGLGNDTGSGDPVNGEDVNRASSPIPEGSALPTAERQLPVEGSFERFLVDLQSDLRIALTQDPSVARNEPIPSSSPPTTTDNASTQPPSTDLPPASIQPPVSPLPAIDIIPSSTVTHDDGQPPEHDDNSPHSDEDTMPNLETGTDSESDFEDDYEDSSPDDDDTYENRGDLPREGDMPALMRNIPPSENLPAPPALPAWAVPLGPAAAGSSGPVGTEDASGRINWWRLYRFPPIVAPRGQNPMEPMRPATTLPTPSPTPDSTAIDPTATPVNTTPLPQTPTPPSNIVIPVIVVGLQSVNMNFNRRRTGGPAPGTGENDGPLHADERDADAGMDDDFDPFSNQNETDSVNADGAARPGTPGGTGGRRWHSRAANALRNLRPGRRGAARQQTSDNTGSRTFLIYVIGGYYPPDHNIITAGPNNLDSFEALLELAELLGQVKPPTVSKEEIDKSGLEIIKLSQLEQHEKDGKISSNCTERCLICLDDYEPEQDIRVLKCRHGFHKDCVDRWLQQGRNNCPACRSKGVSTDDPSPTTL